jgi:hypothetical protein
VNTIRTVLLAAVALPAFAFAAPRVINSCATLDEPGAYVLGRNVAAAGDCFVIRADFVTLDLDGFVVTGNGTGAAVVEHLAVGVKGTTVRNGAIRGFVTGIQLGNSSEATIDRVLLTGSSFTAIIAGDTATVTASKVVRNGGGISLGQRGVVTGSTVNDNQGTGIRVGLGGKVSGNAVGRNSADGISGAEGALISDNVSRNNTRHGISVDCPSAVIGNTSTNNLGDNLHVIGNACDPNAATCCITAAHNSTL